MKIPKQLPQFSSARALIAVLSKFAGVFYVASNGEIAKASEVKEEIPRYSDREGFFVRSGKGNTYASGSVYESPEEEYANRLAKRAIEEMQEIAKKSSIDQIFIFEEPFKHGDFLPRLPKALQEKVTLVAKGNYVKEPPLFFIEKIEKERADRSPAPDDPESVKERGKGVHRLLSKAKQARKVMRG